MSAAPFVLDALAYPAALRVVGESITVLAPGAATGGYEVFLQAGEEGSGPEPHHHPWDETFFVLRGSVRFDLAAELGRLAKAGTLVHVPAGCLHAFRWQAGGGAMLSITSREAASLMFADIDAASEHGRPERAVMDALCGRYGCT